jgi:hypothetical protein
MDIHARLACIIVARRLNTTKLFKLDSLFENIFHTNSVAASLLRPLCPSLLFVWFLFSAP